MNNRSLLSTALAALLATGTIGAQSASQPLVGEWRADAPLPNGVVQTFRFELGGKFDLAMALAVEGSYRIDGSQLVETIALPNLGVTHTDTATFIIGGDSLIVTERGSAAPRVLRRTGAPSTASSIVGDWTITVDDGVAAHYVFGADGTMHMNARVGDEQGKYVVSADTLHLSNEQTFQLPATARFTVAKDILTLTPPDGKPARHFHRVASR